MSFSEVSNMSLRSISTLLVIPLVHFSFFLEAWVGAYLRLYLINLSYQQGKNFLNKMIMMIINYHKNSVPLLLLLPGLSITAVGASLL